MQPRTTAIVDAEIIPLDRAGTLRGWSVLVRDGAIADMRPAADLDIPEDALVIEAGGRPLLPGFVDMHVHIGFPALLAPEGAEREHLERECAADLALYLANGVTTVRNMSGAPFHLAMARAIESGETLGPRLRTTSPILDGAPPVWGFSPQVTDPGEARALVRRLPEEGYEAVKVYNHLSTPVYEALVAAAREVGLPVVGHVPFAVGIRKALAAGQHSIEHFRGYDFDPDRPPGTSGAADRFRTWFTLDDATLAGYARDTVASRTYNCPTLVTLDSCAAIAERGTAAMPATADSLAPGLRKLMADGLANPIFSPGNLRDIAGGKPRQLEFLRRLHDEGAPLLVGTDCGLLTVVPGYSIHDEMANFVAAGLSPFDTLVCCCRNPARYYGDEAAGRIAPGAPADLVLLDADPLRDIANTRGVRGVMAAGTWLSRERLDALVPGRNGTKAASGRETRAAGASSITVH